MPMHIPPSIDTTPDHIATVPSRMGPIANSLSPATQGDILAILQREQDHAMSLLSLSPLLSTLFISYANRTAALELASATPSPESEDWKALQATVAALREKNDKLESENRDMTGKLEAAASSQEAFRNLVAALKEDVKDQQDGFRTLTEQYTEGNDRYNRFVAESTTEKAAFQAQILDLEARREELKETVVAQQIKISKLERQGSKHLPNTPEATEDRNMSMTTRIAKPEQHLEEVGELEKVTKEKVDKVAIVRAEREVAKMAEREVRLMAREEAVERAEREAKEKLERDEGEKSRREKEVEENAEREAKEREEEEKNTLASNKTQSARGSFSGRNDRSRKTSALLQKEQKNEWANTWNVGSSEKVVPSPLPSIFTSPASGLFDGAGGIDLLSVRKKDSPGSSEEVELRPPVTKKGRDCDRSPSNLSNLATPTESASVGRPDALEDLNIVSRRISVSSRSESERWTDVEHGPSPTEPTPPTLVPEPGSGSEAFMSTTPELPGMPSGVEDEVPPTSKHCPAPSPTPARQPPVATATPPAPPANPEPEKPLSLWDRKKLRVASPPPAPASGLFGGGDRANSLGVWGDASGGGGNSESIAVPVIVGDRQSALTETARDRTRENQRENVVEGLLGSSATRRRNDSAQSQAPVKPAPKPAPAPAPAPQKSGGWGSWGSSILTNIASIPDPDRSPSPETAPVKPKIENPPRGFTPSQPPKSQPAGFGSANKPTWGAGGSGDNNGWGATKTGPTPIPQKTSTEPAWGAKPPVSTFGSGARGWGAGTGPSSGSGVGKNLSVDTTTKLPESSPNTAGPEDIPESAVEIKHVPAPGWFGSAIMELNSTASTPSMPNTPDPENGGGNTGGGAGGGGRKKKNKGGR